MTAARPIPAGWAVARADGARIRDALLDILGAAEEPLSTAEIAEQFAPRHRRRIYPLLIGLERQRRAIACNGSRPDGKGPALWWLAWTAEQPPIYRRRWDGEPVRPTVTEGKAMRRDAALRAVG